MKTWGNEKGFIIEGAIAYLLVGVFSVALVALTPVGELVGIRHGQDGKKSTQKESRITTVEPAKDEKGNLLYMAGPDGNRVPLFKKTESTVNLDESEVPKVPLWKRLQQVGWWWIALTIAGFFWGPLGTIMNQINKKAKEAAIAVGDAFKTKYERLLSESQKIVLSVDEGLNVFDASIKAANAMVDSAVASAAMTTEPAALNAHNQMAEKYRAVAKALMDTKAAFLLAMSRKQDGSTKLMVRSLQQPSTPNL